MLFVTWLLGFIITLIVILGVFFHFNNKKKSITALYEEKMAAQRKIFELEIEKKQKEIIEINKKLKK